MNSQKQYVLGLDLGTTSVKAVLLNHENHDVIQTASQDTGANVSSDIEPLGSEQDVGAIIKSLQNCVQKLDRNQLQQVSLIGVSGQMHGCMLWKGKPWTINNRGAIELTPGKFSRLYTWQDSRCTKEFLASVPVPQSHLRLATGHGCASLFWLQRHHPDFVECFDQGGTIMDFVVSILCDLDRPAMSVQNAASWGYFDTTINEWNKDRLSASGFPVHLLPKVYYPGFIAGQLQTSWLGLVPSGSRVGVAMGDLPCSVLSSLQQPTDAVVNIGTSAQMVTRTPQGFAPPPSKPNSAVEYFPFFETGYLCVAAALNGGNVIAAFVHMLQEWSNLLGYQIPKDAMYERVISAGIEVPQTDLIINPTLLGERHQPDIKGSVSNIMTNNLSMGHVVRALCHGIITNLHNMLPREKLLESGVSQIVGCGSALIRNKILQNELEQVFGFPVIYNDGGNNAAVGAALAMILYDNEKQS